ncbi:G-protein coupled receptor dmsr-1-like [Physella acuta]|uniref:G-protein coupled receptor dmsr-1-like n=1 Tax=Physella acuta TaxID=109671 RepID=UPI0027DDC615|nr:G-protein coupled receptor dmsr-1-like [Physella acuta]
MEVNDLWDFLNRTRESGKYPDDDRLGLPGGGPPYTDDMMRHHLGPLWDFHELFLQVYGYASIVVCIFGILTNVINITVLMAKDMRTATNYLLTFLAISDILTMLPYIPYIFHFYCPLTDPTDTPAKYTYNWILYMLIIVYLFATTHTISIWLAVTLAAFRFCQIRSSCPRGPLAKERRIRHVKIAAAIIYVLSLIILIPYYVTNEIKKERISYTNVTFYTLNMKQLGTSDTSLVVFTSYITYAILAKILPCILILIFSGSLLYHMGVKAVRRRQRLSATRQRVNTTRMLLVVLMLFIFTELPQGILFILSVSVPDFHRNVYYPLSELTDFIALLNNAINFVLYCVMSQQFRDKFFSIYIKPICERRRTMITSTSELLILREHVPRTVTTTTHDENGRV